MKNDRLAGVMHWCIYSSFIVLTIVTTLLALDDYLPLIFNTGDEHLFLKGGVYLFYSLVGDVFGIIGLIGVGLAVYRRYGVAPAKLMLDRRGSEDAIVVGMLGLVLFTGFLVEGFRIGGEEIAAGNESWSYWSPGGWVVAKIFSGMSETTLLDVHKFVWWFHIVAAFTLLALMAVTKFRHIILGRSTVS